MRLSVATTKITKPIRIKRRDYGGRASTRKQELQALVVMTEENLKIKRVPIVIAERNDELLGIVGETDRSCFS